MRVTVPDYYEDFRCLAGACPHTCCEKWEVVIDEDTAALYHLNQGAEESAGGEELGELPLTSRILLGTLAGVWALMIAYVAICAIKKKKLAKAAQRR